MAPAYVSPHPAHRNRIIVYLVPLRHKGKWQDKNLELTFEQPLHDIFPDHKDEAEAVIDNVEQAAIELSKVQLLLQNGDRV